MSDILLCRGGFADDTALLRLHHAAHLSVRTTEFDLTGVVDSDLAPVLRSAPACVVFRSSRDLNPLDDGVCEALRQLHERHPHVAFVALVDGFRASIVSQTQATIQLLESGADDVVRVSVEPVELSARVSSVVRRVETWCRPAAVAKPSPSGCDIARPTLDFARRELVGPLGRASLTAKEVAVMAVLLSAPDVVPREELAARLWTGNWCAGAKAIDMHVSNLRRKLPAVCAAAWRIETIRGVGFVLSSSSAHPEAEVNLEFGGDQSPAYAIG